MSLSTVPSEIPQPADPVGAPLRELLALFDNELADVRFPDIDAEVLGAAAGDVEAAFAEVTRLEAALREAQAQLEGTQDVLLNKAGRAVAYSRVFAIGNDELMARIDAINLPRVDRSKGRLQLTTAVEAPKKTRGRKSQPPTETLFAGADDDAKGKGAPASPAADKRAALAVVETARDAVEGEDDDDKDADVTTDAAE